MENLMGHGQPQGAAGGGDAQSRQSGLDVVKCVAALLVVYIHYEGTKQGDDAFSIISQVCNGLARIAVPMFFLITGYYYPRLVERGRMGGHLRKLTCLALGSSLFYIIYFLALHCWKGDAWSWLMGLFTFRKLVRWALFNCDLAGFHLWYFYAVLYDLLILLALDRLKLWRAARPLIAALFLCGLALNFTDHYIHTRNFLFFGLPYVAVGRLLGEGACRDFLRWSTDGQLWACFIVCNLLVVAEFFLNRELFTQPGRDFYLFTLPMAVSLLVLALRHPTFGAGGLLATIGHKYSAYIYILHVAVGFLVAQVWTSKGFATLLFRPLFVFVLATFLSVLLVKWMARLPRTARLLGMR